ncbi:MAG: hypothetical protein WCI63_01440 [bacterium]
MRKHWVSPQLGEQPITPTCVYGKWLVFCPICDQPQPSPHGKDRPNDLECLHCHQPIHLVPIIH